jgi:ring-1,2-phenylacetyl-CoA epoxidase subunit PaaE
MNHLLEFSIENIVKRNGRIILYYLKPIFQKAFRYEAGQFLTPVLSINGKEVRRSYSFFTVSEQDPYPAIAVKRVDNGEVSRYIQDHWKIGDIIYSLPPTGLFHLDDYEGERDLFLIGAGSGIAPLFSILKYSLNTKYKTHVTLVYSNKNKEQALFYEELIRLEDTYKQFHVEFIFSEDQNIRRARLHKELLKELVDTFIKYSNDKVLFFLCGPYEYMRMCEITLISMGFNKSSIRKEIFITNDIQLPNFELKDKRAKHVKLNFRGQSYDLVVPYTKSILDVALDNHIELPYSCRAGKCSTCSATCKQGLVVMSYNEVLTERDENSGRILTCTAHPVSDNVIIEFKDPFE